MLGTQGLEQQTQTTTYDLGQTLYMRPRYHSPVAMSFTGLQSSRKAREVRSFVKDAATAKDKGSPEQSVQVVRAGQRGIEQADLADISMSSHASEQTPIAALQVRESSIAGRGTFATAAYKPGASLCHDDSHY